MNINLTQKDLKRIVGDAYDSENPKAAGGAHFEFTDEDNYDQDYGAVISKFQSLAVDKWGGRRGRRSLNDAQIVQASECALTHVIAGLYFKPALSTFWSGGDHVTITDAGVLPGADKAQWHMAGRRSSSPDDGITPANESPKRTVELAMETKDGRLYDIKHKIKITRRDIQRGEAVGYDAFRIKGEELRKAHMQDLNSVIRRGNVKHGINGMTNYPGIRHRAATANWDSDNADVIYDDYNAAINEIYVSPTEDAMPAYSVLARNQLRHIGTENFGAGTDTTLRTFIEKNNEGHKLYEDPQMATADTFGGPGALFFTPRPDLVRVIAPEYLRVLSPHDENEETISVTIVTRILGVVITDVGTVLFVDGSPGGWVSGF